jgi:hypothetical protein
MRKQFGIGFQIRTLFQESAADQKEKIFTERPAHFVDSIEYHTSSGGWKDGLEPSHGSTACFGNSFAFRARKLKSTG